ncbi:hypothetical protein ACFU9Y_41375, partial [Streptomyces sp. NPDC057621]|uniref:hypothetical protein n=1 Tax=Streptomyces sp. NPDC057621 TaxID=3346186 RepID=UPI00367ACC0B
MTTTDFGAAHPLEDACPVCAAVIGDTTECRNCQWPLSGAPRLGRLTPTVRRAFDEQLSAARRRIDLTAAARACGAPLHTDHERFAQLQVLVREGPPKPGERDQVLRGLEEEQRAFESPLPGVQELVSRSLDRGPEAVVAEITVEGLTATTFCRGEYGTPVEHAEIRIWSWNELLPGLPEDRNAALFLLAGGGGRPAARLVPPVEVESAAGRIVLVNRLP